MRKPILVPYWSTQTYPIRIVSDQRSAPLTSDRIGTYKVAPLTPNILRDLKPPPSCAITQAFIRAQKHTEINIHTSSPIHRKFKTNQSKHSNSFRNVGELRTHKMFRYDACMLVFIRKRTEIFFWEASEGNLLCNSEQAYSNVTASFAINQLTIAI